MISLSEEALATVMRLSQPLAPADRARFLHEMGERLRDQGEVDEGLVGLFRTNGQGASSEDDAEAQGPNVNPARFDGRTPREIDLSTLELMLVVISSQIDLRRRCAPGHPNPTYTGP